MGYESRPATDMASRVMAIFGLIVALGTLIMFLSQSRTLEKRTDLQQSFEQQLKSYNVLHAEKLDAISKTYQDALTKQEQRMGEWNSTLNSVVQNFEDDAERRIARIDEDGREQRDAFRQAIADLRFRGPAEASVLSGPKNGSSVSTDPADARPAVAATGSPQTGLPADGSDQALQVASSRLRPIGEADVTLTLANVSSLPQSIRRIRFRPKSRFSLTADDKAALTLADDSVTFGPEDNKSSTPGYHGTYEHRLATPIVIGANQRSAIRLAIADSEYVGWGFVGKLILDYDDGFLEVDSARVVFE